MKKRFYADYRDWEDYKNGMWNKEVKTEQIEKSRLLLERDLLSAMRRVIKEWPISTKHNLSNLTSNRRSWLGQAACCIDVGSTEFETRLAWKEMSKNDQILANRCADIAISEWELLNNFNKKEYVKEDFTL